MMGIMKAVIIAAGINNKPDWVAVQPSKLCVYKGIIKVELYNPNPRINERIVPTRRLPFFNTLRFTTGFLKVSSLQRKKKKPRIAVTVNKTIVESLNQSSSCPFSNTY